MYKFATILLCCCLCISVQAQPYTSYFTGNPDDLLTAPQGGVCMMGGRTEHNNAMRWFLNRASGGDVLVLRTSGSDGYNNYMFYDLGVTLNSVETIVFDQASAANDEYITQRIDQAEAIWLAGGDQWEYVSYWRNTPIAKRINTAIAERNIVIGGTSAGMAILGEAYFSAQYGTITDATALANPYDRNMTVSNQDFLLVPFLERVITDTHYDHPTRVGRHLTFLARAYQDYGQPYRGIACEEYTAVCIDEAGQARIFGGFPDFDDAAYFLAPNCNLMDSSPETCTDDQALNWNHNGEAVRVYRIQGTPTGLYTFDCTTWDSGDGGDWYYWSVDNGQPNSIEAEGPSCSPVSTRRLTDAIHLRIAPNPIRAAQQLVLQADTPIHFVELFSIHGQLVSEWKTLDNKLQQLQLPKLQQGTYWLRIRSGSHYHTQAIIVQ